MEKERDKGTKCVCKGVEKSKDMRRDNDQCKGGRVKGSEVKWKSNWSPSTRRNELEKSEMAGGYQNARRRDYEGSVFP